MLEAAEQEGKIKPGGTIIEGTSGNTGMGRLAACEGDTNAFSPPPISNPRKRRISSRRGRRSDRMPTNVEPEDPRSAYSVSLKTGHQNSQTAGNVNQYDNSWPTGWLTTSKPGPRSVTEGKVTHWWW